MENSDRFEHTLRVLLDNEIYMWNVNGLKMIQNFQSMPTVQMELCELSVDRDNDDESVQTMNHVPCECFLDVFWG